jgi:adenylyltransferase/sulfurtransferase
MLPSPDEQIEITVSDLDALRASDPDAFRIIDCREDDEWHLCHIEGAQLVPLSSFAEKVAHWDNNDTTPVLVYCHHGMRSMQAAQFLRAKGFENSFSVAGGINAWSAEIDPTVPRY